jgi:hypothetical protein
MTLPLRKTFRQRMLDPRNRRSANVEMYRRPQGMAPFDSSGYPPFASSGFMPEPDLYSAVPLYPDRSTVSEDDRQADRTVAESAKEGASFERRGLRWRLRNARKRN